MAKLCRPLPAQLFLCCVASLIFSSQAGTRSFSIPPIRDIATRGKASSVYSSDEQNLQLTINKAKSSGWAFYKNSIPLWDSSSKALASFSTYFQFVIKPGTPALSGDGLTFFMAPFELEPPKNAAGGYLGLFNYTTANGSIYQMVAVEFDTYQNYWDPDDNHVGIDVNSVWSMANVSLRDLNESLSVVDLKNGKPWDAWVDYDGAAKSLLVFLVCNPNGETASKPSSPILSYDIDLNEFLPENIKVGLSAATGDLTETHTVNAWDFSCEYSWEISPAPSPTPSNTLDEQNPPTPSNNLDEQNPPTPSNTPVEQNAPKGKKNNNAVKVILVAVLCSVVTFCLFIFFILRSKLRKTERPGEESEQTDVELDECFSRRPHKFSYAELCAATGNFSEDEKLGQGGFGGVYRGILPGTGEAVAVKRISEGSKQGKKEYVSEVTAISTLRHRNLVQLLGWCHQKGELLLVYEFLPNRSLDKYLFGNQNSILNWDRRYSIACDTASALVYLHEDCEQRVVHRDVKASNIMLDSDFNAKLGDFGLARLVDRDQEASSTTVVAGTFGYMAPEYVYTGKASTESDVFSFGAVTLEIACGRQPLDPSLDKRLVEWVWDSYGQKRLFDSADHKLHGNFKADEMERLLLLGLLCSHPDPKARPKMRDALKILKFEAQLPNVPLMLPVSVYDYAVPHSLQSSSVTSTSSNITGKSVSSSLTMNPPFSSSSSGSRTELKSEPLLYHSEDHAGVGKGSRIEFKIA